MRFVRTSDEIARIEQELSAPRWNGRWLSVQFLTDHATHRRLLPPPLEPTSTPLATATVGRWNSSCLGDFAGGVLSLGAMYDGVTGGYPLVIYMDSEPATVFGRELFGEPKKSATTGLVVEGDRVEAWIERHGVRLIELQAELTSDHGPSESARATFNYKARTAAGGRGLQEDAILTRADFTTSLIAHRTGTGSVRLTGGPHDPVDEVEIVEVRRVVYGEDESRVRCTAVATVGAEAFLPYHYGRQDDWLALDTLGVRV